MTNEEFKQWFKHHAAAFPSTGKWVQDNEGQLGFWFKVLADADYQDAVEATEALYAEGESVPHTQHAPRIAKIAAHFKARKSQAASHPEATHRCFYCRDTGYVTIVRSEIVRDCLGGKYESWGEIPSLRMYDVACFCEQGTAVNSLSGQFRRRMPVYVPFSEPSRFPMVREAELWESTDLGHFRDKKEVLWSLLETWNPPNYEPAFDDWNAGTYQPELMADDPSE